MEAAAGPAIGPWGILGSEYNLVEKVNVLRGLIDMFTVMYPQLQGIDFRRDVPRLEVPVYILDGEAELAARRDWRWNGSTCCRRAQAHLHLRECRPRGGLRAVRGVPQDPGRDHPAGVVWEVIVREATPLRLWQEAYPGMASVERNLAHLSAAGYRSLGHFIVPKAAGERNTIARWPRIAQARATYRDNPDALRVLDVECAEIELYRQYAGWYGYEFYVMQAR